MRHLTSKLWFELSLFKPPEPNHLCRAQAALLLQLQSISSHTDLMWRFSSLRCDGIEKESIPFFIWISVSSGQYLLVSFDQMHPATCHKRAAMQDIERFSILPSPMCLERIWKQGIMTAVMNIFQWQTGQWGNLSRRGALLFSHQQTCLQSQKLIWT